MNSNDAIDNNFVPYPYDFPAVEFVVKDNLPDKELVYGPNTRVHKFQPPIAHYPNWAFSCPDCEGKNSDKFYELPQDLPEIKEQYEKGELPFFRSCGCKDNNIHPDTLRLWEIL